MTYLCWNCGKVITTVGQEWEIKTWSDGRPTGGGVYCGILGTMMFCSEKCSNEYNAKIQELYKKDPDAWHTIVRKHISFFLSVADDSQRRAVEAINEEDHPEREEIPP